MYSIGIVESAPIFRLGLASLLESHAKAVVNLTTSSSKEVVQFCAGTRIDALFISTDLPEGSGLCLVHRLAQCGCDPRIILYSHWRSLPCLAEAMHMNVHALLHRTDAPEEFSATLLWSMNAGTYRSDRVQSLLDTMNGGNGCDVLLQRLTRTELMVLRCIGEYQTSRQIAQQMSISTHTVKKHRMNIARKLNLSGFHALFEFAVKLRSHEKGAPPLASNA